MRFHMGPLVRSELVLDADWEAAMSLPRGMMNCVCDHCLASAAGNATPISRNPG